MNDADPPVPALSFPRKQAAGQTTLAPPAPLQFSVEAAQPGSDLDVLMGYQVLLGRDPENSQVILDAKSSPVGVFMRACLGSGEFRDHVLQPLSSGRPIRHEAETAGPSAQQRAWLARQILLSSEERAALYGLRSWRALFTLLSRLDGFPQAHGAAAAPAEAGTPAAQAGAPAMVMIALEQPAAQTELAAGSRLSGSGWVIAPGRLQQIDVLLDGVVVAQAQYGIARADIGRRFAHYAGAAQSGFAFSVDLPADLDKSAAHEIGVRARSDSGAIGERTLRLQPRPARIADPFALRLEVAEASIDAHARLRLRGLALSRHEIVQITVFLADHQLEDADCGLPSPEAGAEYAGYGNAARAGFALSQRVEGFDFHPASLRVIARDAAGAEREVLIPLDIEAPEPAAAPAPPAAAHTPHDAPDASGFHFSCDIAEYRSDGELHVAGWAVAEAGLSGIGIVLNGTSLGDAVHGHARADVAARHPQLAGAAASGFKFTGKAPEAASGSLHGLRLLLRAADGSERAVDLSLTAVAARATSSPRAPATAARIEIDRPSLPRDGSAVVLNGAFSLSGWAVAGSGIARIEVSCTSDEGAVLDLGQAHLGMRREDIASAFPDCPGSLFAGYALVQPPGLMPAGQHDVTITAFANDGSSSSRSFRLTVPMDDTLPMAARAATHASRALQAVTAQVLGDAAVGFSILLQAEGLGAGGGQALLHSLTALSALRYSGAYRVLIVAGDARQTRAIAADSAITAARDSLGERQALITPAGLPKRFTEKDGFVLRLRAGDMLAADALQALALCAAGAPQALMLTADDERQDAARGMHAAFAKPAFSPELLLQLNYVGRAWATSAALLATAGLSPAALLELGDWDAVLRLSEAAGGNIAHAPHPVLNQGALADSAQAGLAAVNAALKRRRIRARVSPGRAAGTVSVLRQVRPARVSIIMPTCAARDLVRVAITSIRATCAPHEVEIVVLDNISDAKSKTRQWLKKHADVLVPMPGGFNWSAFNNAGARAASGDFLLFLNDDIEAREAGWLDALLAQASRPEIGIAGARLLYPSGKVQHGGQYLTQAHARHAFRFADEADPGPFGLAQVTREVSAVTGACMLMRREVFEQLGGFDEAHSVVNNDVDMCLRAGAHGLGVIVTPQATLIHHELVSRARIADVFDSERFFGTWRMALLRGDPYHSPRLLAESDHYALDGEPMRLIAAGRELPRAAEIRRILAVKLDHIGDFLTAGPALAALRARFPKARVDVLVPPASAALARQNPAIDRVIEFTFFHARSAEGRREVSEAEYAALAAQLSPLGYDVAIDLRMQPETREVLRHTGAAILAGFDHRGRHSWLDVALEWEGDERLVRKRAHVSLRLVGLVAALQAACEDMAQPAASSALDRTAVAALAALPAAFRGRKLVAVHPGVGNPVRQWPAGHYAALVDLLTQEAGAGVILIGGPEEAEIADQVMAQLQSRAQVVSLAGAVKLADLPAVLRACALFVGNNSGPKHIAASLGVKVIGIHSSVIDPLEWAPLGPRAVAVKREMSCGPCYLEFATDCPRGMACLTGLMPAEIFRLCRSFLGAPPALATAAKSRPAAKPPAGRTVAARARVKG